MKAPAKLICCVAVFFTCISLALAKEINYKELYQNTAPSVVLLYGTDGKVGATGTGSVIDSKGLVLTNTHVVANGEKLWKKQYIILKPDKVTGNSKKDMKRLYNAKVLALHPKYDLALVQIINPPSSLKPLPLSDLGQVGIGEPTVAIGHPGGGAPWSLTTGKISASFEDYNSLSGWDVFQTETSLNPGNSGGPLLDGSGAVIGINTFIVRKNRSGLALTGLNFAVKSTTARKWIKKVIGKLPKASTVKVKKEVEKKAPPKSAEIEKAKPPKPQPKKKAPKAFVEKSDNKNSKEKRKSKLAPPPPRKKKEYTTKEKPGKEYGGSDLDSFFAKYEKEFGDFKKNYEAELKAYMKSKGKE